MSSNLFLHPFTFASHKCLKQRLPIIGSGWHKKAAEDLAIEAQDVSGGRMVQRDTRWWSLLSPQLQQRCGEGEAQEAAIRGRNSHLIQWYLANITEKELEVQIQLIRSMFLP